jgi:cleavage and polyadenylation specificity factor subunit 1
MHAVPPPTETPARNTLLVRFANRLTRACSVPRVIPDGPAARQAQSMLVPFATTSHAGVFLTGSRPSWVVCTDGGGVRAHSAAHGAVHAFAPCPLWGADEFVLYADEGPCLVEWTPGVDVGGALPGRRVRTERPYAHVAYEPVSGLIVAAGALQAPFAAYDEDGVIMWEPEGPNESWPQTDCSTLELMTSDTFAVMDGYVLRGHLWRFHSSLRRYEFATNEFVTAVELVSLETSSTEAGFKEFIAVATTIDRGEDLAVRGAVRVSFLYLPAAADG